jgi:putative ABC transport system ATP-binding protein
MADVSQSNGNLIELQNVDKTYKIESGDVTILKNVSLRVKAGEFVSVVGPSGSGKSTLLNLITGIDQPTDGQVHVCGESIHTLNENQLARWRGENVGIIFQFFQLLPTLTILENVMLPMDFGQLYPAGERKARGLHLLELVGIVEQADKLPTALSGGQQQRAAIARALANNPTLVIADEPTGNLDTATAEEVFILFETLVARGKTVFLVTHDRELSARTQRVVQILDGRIHLDKDNGRNPLTVGQSHRGVWPSIDSGRGGS